MTYAEAIGLFEVSGIRAAAEAFALDIGDMRVVAAHVGGRNIIYRCALGERYLRVSYLDDRRYEDYLAECEFVRYLAENGARVANVISSVNDRLVEKIPCGGREFYVSLFEAAPGEQIAERWYQYIEGRPLSEYFFNCGAALGKLHQLAKRYKPSRRRHDFFDKFTPEYIKSLLSGYMPDLTEKLLSLLEELRALPKSDENYGLVHFDFSDGNYMIDYATGDITVYDFDNACYFRYMYDLANLWAHGVGWCQFEPDARKRRAFMDEYFAEVVKGYRSETEIADSELETLPLMLRATTLEHFIDAFEVARAERAEVEFDGEWEFRVKCFMEDMPYLGFFSDFFSSEHPFDMEEQAK